MKRRIYEIAKELNIDSKNLIEQLAEVGLVVKSPSSTIEEALAEELIAKFNKSPLRSVTSPELEIDEEGRDFSLPKVKEIIGESGEKTSETRIGKTVIRRRVTQAPPPKAPVAEEEAAPKEKKEKRKTVAVKKEETQEPPVVVSGEQPLEQVAAGQENAAGTAVEHLPPVSFTAAIPDQVVSEPVVVPPVASDDHQGSLTREEMPSQPAEVVPEKSESGAKKIPKVVAIAKKRVEIVNDGKRPPFKRLVSAKEYYKKINKTQIVSEEDTERFVAERRKEEKAPKELEKKKTIPTVPKQIKRRIKVGEVITVAELAKRMGIKAADVIKKLVTMGMMLTINQSVDKDTAALLAGEFGFQLEAAQLEIEEMMMEKREGIGNMLPRAPVVTVMGHVDHGKTSLLDAIRKTNVIAGEAGGITQAIGAYHVSVGERDIVFLDTPGHEAFTAMRARGAKVTDIVVLVVAADDGVKETTIEAINHARAAAVPIIVAVNKIDKPEADIDRIKRDLSDLELMPEEWGGSTIFCQISAKQRIGIDELLEMILLQADILELKASPAGEARGVVIESKIDKGRGPVATILIQEGTLREGDSFIAKSEYGKVRALIDDKGRRLKEAGPSSPVEVIGFSNVPHVGSEFACIRDDKKARSIAEYWARKEREKELSMSVKVTLEQLYQRMQEGAKDLNVIIKGDVQGSLEALKEAFGKLNTDNIKLKVLHSSTGAVTETDVILASAANAIIIGFKVAAPAKVTELAQREGVEIKAYEVIYDVIDNIKAAMLGLLEPLRKETFLGKAQVRQVFKISKIGTIAGCYVTDGKIVRNCNVRALRDGKLVYEGKLSSLKRMKDDVKEVTSGYECGLSLENFSDIRDADIIEAYLEERVARKSF